jgi:hypothetical protein
MRDKHDMTSAGFVPKPADYHVASQQERARGIKKKSLMSSNAAAEDAQSADVSHCFV